MMYLIYCKNFCGCHNVQHNTIKKIKKENVMLKNNSHTWLQWLMPVILAPCEAEIQRITVQGQPGKKVCKNPDP
jgi:hypothetical protein